MKYSNFGAGAGCQYSSLYVSHGGDIQLRYYISILLMPWLAHYQPGGQSVGSQMVGMVAASTGITC